MKLYPIEFQTNGTTGTATLQAMQNNEDMNEALAIFHHIMEYAQQSQVEKHGAAIIDENLNIVKADLGYRATPSTALPVFFTFEFQSDDGLYACLPYAFTDKADAWAKWYDVLRVAAKSAVAKHGSLILTSDLFKVDGRLAERNVIVPPEEEPESGEEA